MGKLYIPARYSLGLLCAAALAFPALASTVSVDVSPTTGYSVTNRSTVALPPRATSGPIATYNPTLGPLSGGGAYQTTSSGITITGINSGTASTTMSGRINAGAAAMRNGLTRCLTSFRCNVALAGGAAGVQALFDGIDWIMGEGGKIQQKEDDLDLDYEPDLYSSAIQNWASYTEYTSFPVLDGSVYLLSARGPISSIQWGYTGCERVGGPAYSLAGIYNGRCYFHASDDPLNPPTYKDVPPEEIPPVVDSSYNPDPSDLPYLSTGGLDFGAPDVNFEITDIPSAASDSSTFTEFPDGTSKGTQTEFDFSWSNNSSKQPEVSVDETTTETTYSETGQPTGTTTTTTTTTGTGGGQPPNNEIEIPTDCDFMPTVCRFLEWFQEPDPELGQEPDFTQLIDTIDIEREFQVGSSTAACPAPFQISLAWVPSVEVSLQPFCDLADLLRPFLLSLCFLYSGMIILRT